ncbi:MAG: ZIP family metal transporter [bacterium]|nr:ZIP family metal transporter [bacterium]
MNVLFYIIAASVLVSLISFVGVLVLAISEKRLGNILLVLVSLSAGTLMGGAFLHLLPEAGEKLPTGDIYSTVLLSFIFFFFVEKILHWRHCHEERCEVHTFGYLNLFGDAIHNFLDGLVISAAFLTDINLGLATTLAIIVHEIPQELGDFGVLLYSGFSRKKAVLANFATALVAVLGSLAGYLLSFTELSFTQYLLPFAAGGFIYIAASDLMPEIKKEPILSRSLLYFGVFCLGIGLMAGLKIIGGVR